MPLSPTGAELLFEVFSQRYERGSTVVTSNLPFEDWTSVLGSERLTGALLDRLSEAEAIALAYRRAAHGDAWAALVSAIEDALADFYEPERQSLRRDRLVSRGYIRSCMPVPVPGASAAA